MKHGVYIFFVAALLTSTAWGQYAQGPAWGSVTSGAAVSTLNFGPTAPISPGDGGRLVHRHMVIDPLPAPANVTPPTGPEGSNYISDPSVRMLVPPSVPPIPLVGFQGIAQTNSIPPDPYIAVGPNHVIQVVNTSFRISDKSGTTLTTVTANTWFNNVFPGSGAFDPKVHYDQLAARWIMVWLQQNDGSRTSNYLVSVSDDDNPIGTWWNYALPADVNGSTLANNWADYQGVGYDRDNIYITSNQFAFGGGSQYVKLRIVPKSQLYANTGGAVTWKDFWDLRDQNFTRVFGTRPARTFGIPGVFYCAGASPFRPGSYIVVHRITNPSDSTAAVTAVNVPVTSYDVPPNADQLGGGTLRIEAGGFNVRNEPVYMDSTLWVVHSVASGGGVYSAVRYVRINLLTNTAVEDAAMGADGFWHFYPALAVDKDKNVAITFSRSGLTEYAGAYMTWRLNTDPVSTLRPTVTIQAGRANYVQDFGSGRNRWGDYMGIALDPADRNNFWMLTEYAETPSSTWAVRVQAYRLAPFPGSRINVNLASKDFGLVEVGRPADTTTVTVFNVGANPLTISSIGNSQSAFVLLNRPPFPANVASFDSVTFKITFRPLAAGTVNDTVRIASNDTTNPVAKIVLRGRGTIIGRAQPGVMYASSTSSTAGQLYSLNIAAGTATPIGSLGVLSIDGLAIRPSTKELYGVQVVTGSTSTRLYRVSSGYGDALFTRTIPVAELRAITFGGGDTLWGATTTGSLYRINLTTGDTVFVGNSGKVYSGLAISPTSKVMWASSRRNIIGSDEIYIVNRDSGTVRLVGTTGLGGKTPYIAFAPNGKLYGIKGEGSTTNSLITIDTTTAAGTVVGSCGVAGLAAIAMRTDSALAVPEVVHAGMPVTFDLSQNYPNPFNPTTEIRFALPQASHVSLTVFNLLGQEVARLFEGERGPGYHAIRWNGAGKSGVTLASGIYLYKIQATSTDGKSFVSSKKMILLK